MGPALGGTTIGRGGAGASRTSIAPGVLAAVRGVESVAETLGGAGSGLPADFGAGVAAPRTFGSEPAADP